MMKDMLGRRLFSGLAVGWGLAAVFAAPSGVFAASLGFMPSTKTVSVGGTFTVDVIVSSADQAMNAASGDVSFPADKLQVLSVLKKDSIMNLWIRNPSFSNSITGGDVNFQGIVLNPGFTGIDGVVVQIVFKAVGVGDAPVSFADGSVLANDGNGTNILDSLGAADFTVVTPPPPSVISSPAPTAPSTTLLSPFVASSAATSVAPEIRRIIVSFSIPWTIFFLLLVLIILIALLVYYLMGSKTKQSDASLIRERRELRDDLRRIERKLSADPSDKEMDLDGSDLRQKQESVRREIEHLESDIKRDLEE